MGGSDTDEGQAVVGALAGRTLTQYGVTAGVRVVCLPGGGLAVWSSGG